MLVEFERPIPVDIEKFLMENYAEQILAMSPQSVLFKPKAELEHVELEAVAKAAGMALKISVPAVGASCSFGKDYLYTYTPLGWILNLPIGTASIQAEFEDLAKDFDITDDMDEQLRILCQQYFVAGALWAQAKERQ